MKQLLQLCLLIGLLSACNGNSITHSDKEPLIQKESDSKTKIIGTWMLLSIGEQS
jgi:hypothetical protein